VIHKSILEGMVGEEQILFRGASADNNNNNNAYGSPSSSPKSINSSPKSSPDSDAEIDGTLAIQNSMGELKIKEIGEDVEKLKEFQAATELKLKGLSNSHEALKDDVYHKKSEEDNKRRKGELNTRVSGVSREVSDEELQKLILEVLQQSPNIPGSKVASYLRNRGISLDGSKRVNRVLHTQMKPAKLVVEEDGLYSIKK